MYFLVNPKGFVHPLIRLVFVVSTKKPYGFWLALKQVLGREHVKTFGFLVSLGKLSVWW